MTQNANTIYSKSDRHHKRKKIKHLPKVKGDINTEGKIIVIGDSHVNFFSGNEKISFREFKKGINNCDDKIDKFVTFHLGPALAYNLSRYNSKTKAKEKIEWLIKKGYITKNSIVILVFGEIDIRTLKTRKISTNIEYEIKKIVNNYLQIIPNIPGHIYIWAPIGQGGDCDIKFGTQQERNKMTQVFIDELRKREAEYNYKTLSIFEGMVDGDYNTDMYYITDDLRHLSQRAWELADKELQKISTNDYYLQ